MPLFTVVKTTLSPVDQTNFAAEKDLQALIESNLESVFGCRSSLLSSTPVPNMPDGSTRSPSRKTTTPSCAKTRPF